MRRDDPGLDAGRAWGARQATVVGGAEWRPGVPVLPPEPHRGVLTSGAADQLAALAARAAHAPVGLIHFVQGGRLRLYGGWGLSGSWDAVADAPAEESLAGLVLSSDAPVLVTDVASDDRVLRRRRCGGSSGSGPIWAIPYATSTAPCSASAACATTTRATGPPTKWPRSPRRPRCAPC